MSKKIDYITKEIIDQYLHDENKTRPWIIGFSGGKDSTVVLQLIWNALLEIDKDKRTSIRRAADEGIPVAAVARPQVFGSHRLATVATGKVSSAARLIVPGQRDWSMCRCRRL